jgi:hypothetical protein
MHEHALSNLRYIRDAMERASAFTSIPGWGGVMVGVTALVTTYIGHRLLLAGDGRTWLLTWLAEAVVAVTIAGVTMWRKGRRLGVAFDSKPARRFFISYFAPMAAGAGMTYALGHAGRYDLLPSAWLLLYGASFISSGAFSIRVVPVMGACFMVLGFISCFLSFVAGNALLGAGFGLLHILFGYNIARSHGG